MKNVLKPSLACAVILISIFTAQAQTLSDQIKAVRDLTTRLVVVSSQTESSAHRIIVFQEGNKAQLARSIEDTNAGLDEINEQLGFLRRIAHGIVSNQRADMGARYRSRSQKLQNGLNNSAKDPKLQAVYAREIQSLMGDLKHLAQEIRVEVMNRKNEK